MKVFLQRKPEMLVASQKASVAEQKSEGVHCTHLHRLMTT
jgi:hypothetical protein